MTNPNKLADALRWFLARKAAIQAKFDLHGPVDTAASMREAYLAAEEALAEHDAQPAPAPAADGAGELPPLPVIDEVIRFLEAGLPTPTGGFNAAPERLFGMLHDLKQARAAIAALRQPVPDAVREEVVGAIAKPATGWDVAGNYGDGKWRAFRLEKQQTYLGDPKSSEMEAIAETHRLAASFSQQESRND